MRLIQAIYWLRGTDAFESEKFYRQLDRILKEQHHGQAIIEDLREGFHTLPAWIQSLVREYI
ncbi:hypothetical protein PAN31117_00613 [Pandoraea anapnoica]|uniref:Uncharacterized protein n=1 Tax=Pandoraea anapnoica TaxID=2508301 RepID=A0A5E4ZMF5_9BURK|nr:hypothetical protein PAN31117_00613 [Pandoraea anapnoica]